MEELTEEINNGFNLLNLNIESIRKINSNVNIRILHVENIAQIEFDLLIFNQIHIMNFSQPEVLRGVLTLMNENKLSNLRDIGDITSHILCIIFI